MGYKTEELRIILFDSIRKPTIN